MKNWKVWILTDKDGKELARGRKKDVIDVAYTRYVYGHIFTEPMNFLTNRTFKSSIFFISKVIACGRWAAEKLYHTSMPFVKRKSAQKNKKFLILFCALFFSKNVDKKPGILYNKDS